MYKIVQQTPETSPCISNMQFNWVDQYVNLFRTQFIWHDYEILVDFVLKYIS